MFYTAYRAIAQEECCLQIWDSLFNGEEEDKEKKIIISKKDMRNENIKQSKRAHTHTHTQISSLEELCSLPLPTYKEQV